MNEIYRLLQNVHEIAKANNLFLIDFERRVQALEAKLTIEQPEEHSEPNADGAEQTIG